MRRKYTSQPAQVRIDSLCGLARLLSLPIKNIQLLDQALTHTSYANEHRQAKVVHNERLEFLGDAILDLVVGEYLFKTYPHMPEGELTKARASIVCEETLSACSKAIGLGKYLLLGKGEKASGGAERASILADAFEALLGAIYIDCSYEVVESFVLSQLQGALIAVDEGTFEQDYKTLLQEFVQRKGEQDIRYELLASMGPDHNKIFTMVACINGVYYESGVGKSKKEAEQQAAKLTLDKIRNRTT